MSPSTRRFWPRPDRTNSLPAFRQQNTTARKQNSSVIPMLDYLLAIGIALSVASQLRLAIFPLGPGEFCIALWIAITLLKIALDGASPDMPALRRLSLFWSLFAFALSLGACVRYYVDETVAIDDVWHDSLAYLLMAAMTCLAAATAGPHALRRI